MESMIANCDAYLGPEEIKEDKKVSVETGSKTEIALLKFMK